MGPTSELWISKKTDAVKTFASRWRGIPGHPYEQGFDLRLWAQRLEQPLKWTRPQMIFVNSMSDLFHEDIPPAYMRVDRGLDQDRRFVHRAHYPREVDAAVRFISA